MCIRDRYWVKVLFRKGSYKYIMVFHYIQTEGTKVITQSNLYNGNGQRVQKTEGDNTINYFYQGNNVLYTTNGDGNKTSHNFIGLEGNTISTIRYNLAGLEY